MRRGIEQYKKVGVDASVLEACPHQLIQMLMQGFLDRVASAKGFMERKNYTQKCNFINKATDIVRGLQSSLDMEKGGDISADLHRLYDYIIRRLIDANRDNNQAILDEVMKLMNTIKEGWDSIPENIRQEYAHERANAACQSTEG